MITKIDLNTLVFACLFGVLTGILILISFWGKIMTITETINNLRNEVTKEYKQTILDEMDDEDLIIYALNFLKSNLDEEVLLWYKNYQT